MAAEQHRAVKGRGMPDLIVRDPLAAPVVLETEYLPARTVENDAVARLGARLTDSGDVVEQCIAVRVPGATAERGPAGSGGGSRRRDLRVLPLLTHGRGPATSAGRVADG